MSSQAPDHDAEKPAESIQPAAASPAPPGEGQWIDLCPIGEVTEQAGKYFGSKTHSLAIFRVDPQTVQVMDDTCPHAGASLAAGYIAGGKVYCPWHGWPFNLADGACADNGCIKVKTYPTRVVDGVLQARLE